MKELLTCGRRLRDERVRLGMSQSELAEVAGVSKMSQLNYEKDVRRPDVEYLASVAEAGVDVLFVVTGKRHLPEGHARQSLSEEVERCLTSLGVSVGQGPHADQTHVSLRALARLLNMLDDTGASELVLDEDALTALASYDGGSERELVVQAVQLAPYADRSYVQVLMYLARTPPDRPYALAPDRRVPRRVVLDEHCGLPVRAAGRAAAEQRVLLVISDDEAAALEDGESLRVAQAER